MGQDSKIEWTHHTFNPWRGCTNVSAGCDHCYAERMSGRNPKVLGVWGKDGARVVAADAYWKQPIAWNAAAEKFGQRVRVFCASLADVFEGEDSMPAESWPIVEAARIRLLRLIRDTPWIDWLLLTKRPENWREQIERALITVEGGDPDDDTYFEKHGDQFCESDFGGWLNDWLGDEPPANVWIGTSVENQAAADERRPHLVQIPAAVRFLSIEPLLGPIELDLAGIHWVIVGGESGAGARPMHPLWVESLRDQCVAAGVPFFFKQWGEWKPIAAATDCPRTTLTGHFGFSGEWNSPTARIWGTRHPPAFLGHVGKKAAGRMLDRQTWDQLPAAA